MAKYQVFCIKGQMSVPADMTEQQILEAFRKMMQDSNVDVDIHDMDLDYEEEMD